MWTLLSEPTHEAQLSPLKTVKTDYLSGHTVKKHYKNQWDMTNQEFQRALDLFRLSGIQTREKIFINWGTVDKALFAKAFAMAQEGFQSGKVEKVVPIAVQKGQLEHSITETEKCDLLYKLTQAPMHLIPYGEWSDDDGFLGATPEVLFEKTKGDLRTMALAGTSDKDIDPNVFLQDPKERKEHQIVIDDIVESLKPLGEVHVGDTQVVEFPALNHLETKISARVPAKMTTDALIKTLHPTPALGIYPRNDYFETFRNYPNQSERGFFGAPWGIESEGSSLILVAIRKWDWSGKDVQIFAGCGVVSESILEKEFAEILKKIDSVKRLFF